ncbi:MAG: carboxy terminal-processing peptidase, partial [Verrucomicrobia bacterium]|nr:carboxy terminal-processing peptidase [Verrucomicrobiota bacterium]
MKIISIVTVAVLSCLNACSLWADEKSNAVDPRQIDITVGRLLEQGHYSRQKLDGEASKRALQTYLNNLDYNKLFFTQEDIDQLTRRYGSTLGDDILLGDLQPAREIYNLFRQRVEDRVAKIRPLLKKDYTFKSNKTVALDRRKEPWPANAEEADSLWRDRIEGELLQEKLNKFAIESGPKIVGKRYDQLLKNVQERDDEDLVQFFLNSVAQSYDPHSEYLGRSDLESFEINMRLSLTGIGAELRSEDGFAKIQRLLPGGPAQLSGKMNVGDRIAAVAQNKEPFVDTVDLKLEKVVELIRGKKGTVVRLQVIPANANDPSKRHVVELVRDNVKLTEQEAKAEIIEKDLPDGSIQKIGWITLPSFYQDMEKSRTGKSTTRDVSALLKRLEQEGIQGLVIDLRRDGGGSLDEAIKMSGLFINQGPVVQVKDANGDIDVLKDRSGNALYTGPMIVLVNKLSASASEIFAAAMQDYGRALIIGDSSTFGKGTVQTMLELGRFMPMLGSSLINAGALKLTVQKFYRVAGGSTQLRGVISDVKLPSLTDNPEFGEAALEHPLPYDEVEPAPIDIATNRKPLFVDELRQRSANRVAQDPEFQDIAEDMRQLNERLKNNRLALNEKIRRDEMTKEVDRKTKEKEDHKVAEQNDHYRRFELNLGDLDKPHLK